MEFTSYQLVENNSSSLNTGSYLNRTESSLFVKGYSSDLWYAYSSNDVMELGLWDRDGNLLNWKTTSTAKFLIRVNLYNPCHPRSILLLARAQATIR